MLHYRRNANAALKLAKVGKPANHFHCSYKIASFSFVFIFSRYPLSGNSIVTGIVRVLQS